MISGASFSLEGLLAWGRAAFTQNLGLKGLSLVFALGLVAYHRVQQDEQQRTIPVGVVLRLPDDSAKRALMTTVPANVHVTVRGAEHELDAMLQAGVPPVELDLRSGYVARVNLEPGMFTLPHGVELKVIDPVALDLEWEDVITREIPIQSPITGNIADGYEKGEVLVEPKTIGVQGPRSLVEVMQFARLAAFDVSGKTNGLYRHPIALDPPPAGVRYVGESNATVAVEIRRRTMHEKFQNLQVEILGGRAMVKPSTVDVTVRAPQEVIAGLRSALVVPRVDIAAAVQGSAHGSAVLPVVVDLANADAEIQPPTVLVSW
ncbi:MAG TPA: YbbR-like domain-containing protein [Polyangiaceae bacterium]|nr:YbbR-like domain-containing protein [Polyangiaceae bacterium]